MDLRFIGIGAAFAPALGNNSAFFSIGMDLYLIDCGEQVFSRLIAARLLERYPSKLTVILTHTHADHFGSLGTLCLYCGAVLGKQVTVVHPNPAVDNLLAMVGVSGMDYTRVEAIEGPELTVTPMATRHAAGLCAYAYHITDAHATLYYSGDTVEFPEDVLAGLKDGTIERAYQDVMLATVQGDKHPPHLLYSELVPLIAPSLRERITLMHLNKDFRAQAIAEGFQCAEVDPLFIRQYREGTSC